MFAAICAVRMASFTVRLFSERWSKDPTTTPSTTTRTRLISPKRARRLTRPPGLRTFHPPRRLSREDRIPPRLPEALVRPWPGGSGLGGRSVRSSGRRSGVTPNSSDDLLEVHRPIGRRDCPVDVPSRRRARGADRRADRDRVVQRGRVAEQVPHQFRCGFQSRTGTRRAGGSRIRRRRCGTRARPPHRSATAARCRRPRRVADHRRRARRCRSRP